MTWPGMTRKEALAFIMKYAKEIKSNDVRITGVNKHDKTFTFHLPHNQRVWPALTARITKRLGLSKEEFYSWWKGERTQ